MQKEKSYYHGAYPDGTAIRFESFQHRLPVAVGREMC
jgi:hypothetical protein